MFNNLSNSLQKVFKNLRGHGKLSEKNVTDALREVRLALLEADVHYEVVKQFIKDVKQACLGEEVLNSITPGQQITKRIHEQMVKLLGENHKPFELNAKPAMIMMLGLHGAGKTTTTGKLAVRFQKEGKKVLLVACDIRRPAAVDQLATLAQASNTDIIRPNPGETVPELGIRAKSEAVKGWYDVVIFDTGGRFQIDQELVQELKDLRQRVNPQNLVLVVDAAIGQESVNVASAFNEAVGLTGLILTKMDGDARGGAALSIQHVTGCPVHLIGVGEKAEDLEAFHPERIASRILGMGDVISLVEQAQQNIDQDEAARMQERLFSNQFNFEDMLSQFKQMKKLGPIDKVMGMMPGMPRLEDDQKDKIATKGTEKMKKFEAIILSMTPYERRNPKTMNASRRKRIAKGSGTEVRDVNELIKQHRQMQDMSKKLKKMQKKLLRMGK